MNRSLFITLAASLVPALANAQPDTTVVVQPQPQVQVVPAPTTVVTPESDIVYDRWNAPVFLSGALVFAASYGAAVIESDQSNHPGADRLAVPVVGPWLALNDWGNCPVANPGCDRNTTDKVLLVADGVFQAAGLIGMVDALIDPSHHMHVVQTAENKKGIHFAPTGNGVKVFGAF